MASIPPSQTLYIKNLNDKISKNEIRLSLYAYFAPYGRLLDIVVVRTRKMRGQAFVVYMDPVAATAAFRDCQGKMFYDKQMVLQYAKTKSVAVQLLDGTWKERQVELRNTADAAAIAAAGRAGMANVVLGKRGRNMDGDKSDSDDDENDDANGGENDRRCNNTDATMGSSKRLHRESMSSS